MLQLPTFSRKEDPYEHIQNFKAIMHFHRWEDTIMCRAFPITLKDHACLWFNRPKDIFLSCFDHLRKKFFNAFIINFERKKYSTYFLSIRWSEKEILRECYSWDSRIVTWSNSGGNASKDLIDPITRVVVSWLTHISYKHLFLCK